MIVNSIDTGWEVIFHRAHALLAAQIALRWDTATSGIRIAETIAAIAQHDDLEREFEGGHLTAAGTPMDFMLRPRDDETEIPRWQESIETALYRSRWVALLTAMHVLFLNETKRAESKKLERFCKEVEENCRRWHQELDIPPENARESYALMQWCDRLSLILAKNEVPARERWLEISVGPDGVRHDVLQRDGDSSLTVEPWPFRVGEFSVGADVRLLTDVTFSGDVALIKALKEASIQEKTWTFRR